VRISDEADRLWKTGEQEGRRQRAARNAGVEQEWNIVNTTAQEFVPEARKRGFKYRDSSAAIGQWRRVDGSETASWHRTKF
jgi:hypothetical protein